MVARVDTNHVHQVSRAHGPAEFFHDLVDTHEVDARADQTRKAAEIRKQHAIDQKARAIVDHDRVLAHFLGVGNGGGHRLFAGMFTADDFDQRHHVHRVEEMHADEILRTLERLGQQRNRNGRGIGRQNGALLDLAFYLGKHRLLDLGVLDHGLDDDIDMAKVAIRQGRTDVVECFSHFCRCQTAFFNTAAQQLGSFGQTLLDALLVDVLHQDRRTLEGRLIGDPAAHDAGAEHGSLGHFAGDLVVGLGFALELLIVEEKTDETLGSRGLGHLDETCGLDFDRLVTAEVGGFLNGLDGFDRRRVIGTRLAGDETFCSFESHHLLDGIELDFLQLGLTLGLVVELAADGAPQQVQRSFAKFFRGHHCIYRANLEGVVGTVFLARSDPLDGVIDADHPWQAHSAAETWVDTELDLGQADLGLGGHDPVVGGQGQLKATAQRNTVDGNESGDGEVFKVTEDPVDLKVGRQQLGIGQLEIVNELGDVGTHDEHVFGAAHEHAFD